MSLLVVGVAQKRAAARLEDLVGRGVIVVAADIEPVALLAVAVDIVSARAASTPSRSGMGSGRPGVR